MLKNYKKKDSKNKENNMLQSKILIDMNSLDYIIKK